MENYTVPFPRHRRWHCSSSSWLVPKRSKKSRKKRRLQNYRSSFCLRNTVGGTNQIPTSSHLTHLPNYTFKRNMLVPWNRWTWWTCDISCLPCQTMNLISFIELSYVANHWWLPQSYHLLSHVTLAIFLQEVNATVQQLQDAISSETLLRETQELLGYLEPVV